LRRVPSQVFISYRRGDTTPYAGRIYDRLLSRFGEGNVFMDVDAIEPGVDFGEHIERAVGACDVLVAVIGDDWLSARDEQGRRRIDDPDDFVRLEVEAGLARGDVRVIPVLVHGAQMPSSADLPPEVAGLARRSALEMSDARWTHDIGRLVETVEKVLAGRDTASAITESGAAAPASSASPPAPASPGQPPPPPPPTAAPGTFAPAPPPEAPNGGAGGSRWLAIGLGVLATLAIVVVLAVIDGGSHKRGSTTSATTATSSLPKPLEPLVNVLPDFQRAVNSGDCRRLAEFRHSLERPAGVGPGDAPSASECRLLEQAYAPLKGLRVGPSRTFGIAAVVDGTVGRETVSLIWALDADRRWAHVARADRFGGAAGQVGTAPTDPVEFDVRANDFLAALRKRDCRTAFWLLNPESARVLASGNDQGRFCAELNRAFDAPASLPGEVLGDPSGRLEPLGKTKSHAFYALDFPKGDFWTLVVSDAPTNADPARVKAHAPNVGVYGWF
jgi:hypothetical protein